MQNSLVSILIPFKNTEHYLTECLASLLNQTYTHWELIIVDDHSTDNSYNLVKSVADADSRITLLKNEGFGIISALQLAFSYSEGKLITRMDSDDIMHTSKIETLAKNLITHGRYHVATGLVHYFSEEGISDGYRHYENWLNKLTITGNNYSEIYKECVIPSPCWMVYKKDLEAVNAFNTSRYPEDYDLTFRFYDAGYKVIPCENVLHYWRDYTTRASRTNPHYAQNSFIDLKLHYFLKLNKDISRPLVVWGAGKKGKTIAKRLITLNIPFYWVCNNPKKIGKHIYNQEMKAVGSIATLEHPQCIVSVANPEAQSQIKNYFESNDKQSMQDYFFFC
ncbi:glycosyltransferase family 2 protein [Bizionia gelidisalsuginis]|uniref:Glycosyltransferase family 2 protein n=1 Tax=Bizionia gelidisalsuginis TaxID=291188 RepID=A0ABY3M9T4_9FLAO|nr:glycosyltransferase family 2 protein [Bizionia gelidisalsuginis]TYC12005.1 glycosyltransferase family 2 protein [Bizionia gelidisalsuginis]